MKTPPLPTHHFFVDLTGKRFGRLTVVRYDGKRGKQCYWLCKCDCGNTTTVQTNRLKSGKTRSCKCIQRETRVQMNLRHGMSKSGEYGSWVSIRARCCNKNSRVYHRYGGRGIRVCKRWMNSFDNFLADMGKKPTAEHTIERRNGKGHYCPSNCYWATRVEQANNKSNNHLILAFGKTMTLSQWSREYGVSTYTIRNRIQAGWGNDRAVSEPTHKWTKR